ncbi:MAG: sugar phosphate isomerase/epimerase [Cyclobacteriaceae bacterium]|nr:sugar phosphate isomerase/epimerase [Cyclobacteriaceae bacterium]
MQSVKNNPSNFTRRRFLKTTASASAALSISPKLMVSCKPADKSAAIAMQIYTVRREIEKDLQSTLEKVAEIGYSYVETAFWPDNISLTQAAQALQKANLKVCSMHCELPSGKEESRWLEMAQAFDCDTLIWHGWPEDPRYSTQKGIEELADIYNRSYEYAAEHELKFGLHNHWWEFRNRIDGRYPYQILLEYIEPEIFFEIDTYWVKVAGLDPAQVLKDFGSRAPFLHIKDGPAKYTESLGKDEPEPMVAVGQGTQDFPSIASAGKGNTIWMIVEMDVTATDVFIALEESYHYLTSNGLATP